MMKLNWGHKIIFVFLAFVTLMVTLVYKSVKTDFDLVSKEYYKDELAYQNVIDATSNAYKLSSGMKVDLTESQVVITLPEEMKGKSIKGAVHFYCPIQADNDRKVNLEPDLNGIVAFNKTEFITAPYTVKVTWEADGINYYSEEKILIN
ncbi:MAG: FixH family protein [Flavitalea sp.]